MGNTNAHTEKTDLRVYAMHCMDNSNHVTEVEQNPPIRRGELFGEVAVSIKEEALLSG